MPAQLVGGLLTAALLAGCGTGATSAVEANPRSAEVAPAAPPCEELPEDAAPPGPDALPPLKFSCLGPGPDVSLDRLTGRPTLVNLWATWCAPCREEMPLLQDAYASHGHQIRFLGVDIQDDAEAASWFLTDLDVGYPHVVDPDGELLRELGMRGLPVTLALDEDGQVVGRSVGQLTPLELEDLIDTLLS